MFLLGIILMLSLQGCYGLLAQLSFQDNKITAKQFTQLDCSAGMVVDVMSIECYEFNECFTCNSIEFLAKFQRLLNFKSKPILSEDFHSECFSNLTGSLLLDYVCVSEPVCLSINCKTGDQTCIPSTTHRQCQCIDVPDHDYENQTLCSGATYMGCFDTSIGKADLTVNLTSDLTPDLCIRMCQLQGFMYAAVAGNEGQCQCYNIKLDQGIYTEDRCLRSCHYKTSVSCGNYPFAHFYNTGLRSAAGGSLRCSSKPCLRNTTRCLDAFSSHICVCNEKENHKLPLCAGCLEDWFSGNVVNKCYSINKNAFLSKSGSLISTHSCSSIYGEAITIKSITEAVFAIRILTDYLITNGITGHFKQLTINDILKSVTSLHQYPICERPKLSTIGRYPWAKWPYGSFGIPGAITGCPYPIGIQNWIQTRYRQDTEDDNNSNSASTVNHFDAVITNDTITRSFCMRDDPRTINGKWPEGRYCIYKKYRCPPDFEEGQIFWDDEDNSNNNTKFGTVLPDGMFNRDTKITYCCRQDDGPRMPIVLPRDKPFYLFPVRSKSCESVSGTVSSLEYIIFDIENTDGSYSANVAFYGLHPHAEVIKKQTLLKLYFCYYKPVPWCGYPKIQIDATIIGNGNFSVGTKIRYGCRYGYQNIGDSEDICLPHEQWASLTGPICVDIDECATSNTCHVKANCYNTQGAFHCKCNPGWQGDGKSCTAISCPHPLIPVNGFIKNQSNIKDRHLPNTAVAYGCNEGYLLIGYNATVCRVNGHWYPPPMCKDELLCTPTTYKCILDNLYSMNSDSLLVANCSCDIRNYITRPPYDDSPEKERLRKLEEMRLAVIGGCCALAFVALIGFTYFLIKRKRQGRRRLRHLIPMDSLGHSIKRDPASGVYAEIHEIHCGIEMAAKCPISNKMSNCSNLSIEPPNPPPRQNSTISCDSNFDNATSMTWLFSSEFGSVGHLRRHTVFTDGESLLTGTPILNREGLNKQLSFQGDRSSSSFAFDHIPTRFKLNSHERLASRRASEMTGSTSSPQSPLCFNGRKGRRRSSQQSLTPSDTGPRSPDVFEESEDIFCIPENPYLDLVEYENRAKRESMKAKLMKTNTEILRTKQRAASQKMRTNSKFIPIRKSSSTPNIYIASKEQYEEQLLLKKRKRETRSNPEGRITFKFHLSADLISRSNGNSPAEDNQTNSELYSRLKRYNMNVSRTTDAGSGFYRIRSDTNPI